MFANSKARVQGALFDVGFFFDLRQPAAEALSQVLCKALEHDAPASLADFIETASYSQVA